MNGLELLDKNLVVQRASIGAKTGDLGMGSSTASYVNEAQSGNAMGMGLSALMNSGAANEPTKVVVLMNMVTVKELSDPEEYEDICEDVRDECEKFGKVSSIHVPKPSIDEDGNKGIYFRFLCPCLLHRILTLLLCLI